MTHITEQQARADGRRAREEHRGMDTCPQYGNGETAYQLRRAFREEWLAADQRKLHEVAKR